MPFTLCSTPDVIGAAGSGTNWNYASSGANMDRWSDQAEGKIAADTLYDWVTNISSVNKAASGALIVAAASWIANQAIKYDTSGFLSRAEAELMMDVNDDNYRKAIAVLKEKNKAQDFLT